MVMQTNLGRFGWALAVVALSILLPVAIASAQPAPVVVQRPQGPMSPEQAKAMMEAQQNAARAAAGGAQPAASPGKEEKKEEPKKEGEDDKKKEEGGDAVKRPETAPRAPDPRDFDVQLDAQGRVPPFNFIGQPWQDVMQWYANLSKTSFDWLELPSGYLNLTTQRAYPLDEVRDLLNRHLHARGYTAVQSGGMLSVYKIEKLDPSVVRRVDEEDLYDLKPYDFVKLSFELPTGMEVEKAKEDVKQVLSPNAKVFPLVTTKRLLVLDSVANLRLVSALLNEERAFQEGRVIPRNFILKYARPEQVIETLYVVLGIDPQAKPAQTDPRAQQQMMQQIQQMQKQGQDVSKLLKGGDEPQVYLAYNRQLNSVMANAPPEQMKIIEQTINLLDVPYGGNGDIAGASDTGERTLQKYQLVTMDPEQLMLTLKEIGQLDPRTELRADTKAKLLFARATEADHQKIAALRDELDGTGRRLHVVWLPRRLPADAVAGTIYALMGGQQEEEEEQQYPFYYYSYRNRSNNDDEPKKGFRIDADVENNRLLLWANEAEHKEVQQFLIELRKASPGEEEMRTVRSIETADPEATARALEQLRRAWPALGENELIIEDNRPQAASPPANEEKEEDDAEQESAETKDRATSVVGALSELPLARMNTNDPRHNRFRLAADAVAPAAEVAPGDAESTSGNSAQPAATAEAPVTITVTEDGRLVIASQDTEALDRLERYLGQLVPPSRRYKIFRIKYADVYDVYLNLTEYFEEELKGENEQILDWWGYYQDSEPETQSLLSKRPALRFIWDPASNSILVSNASASQLAEIEQLINEYDRPTPDDDTTERITKPIKIRYSKASTIAAAVKEVYRDLLSSKDKEFDSKETKGGSTNSGVTVIRFSPGGNSDDGKRSAPIKVGFQGALSLGADDTSNIVLVSAQKDVFESVEAMILQLDSEAAPSTTVHVHRVTGGVTAEALQKAIDRAMSQPWIGGRPEQSGTQQVDGRRDGDRDRNRDRDRGRDRGRRGRDRDND